MISTSLKFVGNTPVYQLDNTNIFVKLEKYNLGGSVKDRAVLGMLEEAMSQGAINKDTIIVEPTSGNTGIAVAILASVLGLKSVIIMPESMSIERRNIIKAYGAQLIISSGKSALTFTTLPVIGWINFKFVQWRACLDILLTSPPYNSSPKRG